MANTEFQFNYNDYFAPDSSVIEEVYYNGLRKEMVVGIAHGGYVNFYGYAGVSPVDFGDFRRASSAGHFYNTAVKGKFTTMPRDPGGPWIFIADAVRSASQIATHNAPPVAGPKTRRFKVSAEVVHTVDAISLEDAIAKFRRGDSLVSEITVTGATAV